MKKGSRCGEQKQGEESADAVRFHLVLLTHTGDSAAEVPEYQTLARRGNGANGAPPASEPSITARLDRLPATRTHRYVTIIAGIGSFFDLFDIFLAGVLGTVLH